MEAYLWRDIKLMLENRFTLCSLLLLLCLKNGVANSKLCAKKDLSYLAVMHYVAILQFECLSNTVVREKFGKINFCWWRVTIKLNTQNISTIK